MEHWRAEKAQRAQRKLAKRNRQPDRVRDKSWKQFDPQDQDVWEEVEIGGSERIMARDEKERRFAISSGALASRHATQGIAATSHADGEHGVVTEVASGICRVDLAGRTLLCTLHSALGAAETGFTNVVAVGDDVRVANDDGQWGIITAVLPRHSALVRADWHDDYHNSNLRHVIVANADQLLIVAAWRDPVIWLELIDRYLITAQRNNLMPIICVNKVDLAAQRADCHAAVRPYIELGHRILWTSAISGEGVDELREMLRGRTTVLAGVSGVGKSSLLALIQPGLHLRTAEVSAFDRQGRHTTTQVSMYRLDIGGYVVDTPGIREFGLAGLTRRELVSFFPEIIAVQGCRFADCAHLREPGCAVRAAVRQWTVPLSRYESYRKIYESLS